MQKSGRSSKPQTMDAKAARKKAPDEQQTTLTASKDRAQLTATTAMSLVHVALLNTLINEGAEKNKFYTPVLILIIITLVIQVIIGILAILVTQIRNYYDKFNSDMCDELCFCCPRKRRKIKRPYSYEHELKNFNKLNQDSSGFEIHFDDIDSGIPNTAFQADNSIVRIIESAEPYDSVKTSQPRLTAPPIQDIHPEEPISLDDWTFDNYDHVDVLLLKSELKAIDAEIQLKQMLSEDTQPTSKASSSSSSDGARSEDREKRRDQLEQHVRRRDVLAGQKEVLSGRVDEIHQADILKKVSFWQNIINYLLYFVFISNAFITGLGVAGKGNDTLATPTP